MNNYLGNILGYFQISTSSNFQIETYPTLNAQLPTKSLGSPIFVEWTGPSVLKNSKIFKQV